VAADENKRLMERVFAELSGGNGRPFFDSMADDVTWTIIGSTKMVEGVCRQAGCAE
jgi:ketosteroid isomerase-like protein